jgi:hypothetical protein
MAVLFFNGIDESVPHIHDNGFNGFSLFGGHPKPQSA